MTRDEELKQKSYRLGELSPGSIQTRWLTCGKPECRCATGQKHGPYYYFAYRDRRTGKTAQISVPGDVATELRNRIGNYEKFKEELWELVEIEVGKIKEVRE